MQYRWWIGIALWSLIWTNGAAQEHIIRSVFFGGGSAYVSPDQAAELARLVETLGDLDLYQISISSHTDNIGGKEYNQWLSEQRSQAVIRTLGQFGVPPERVLKRDEGQENPLYDNQTLRGRMANRRVDIHFQPLLL
ncbi:MAG: OmpA family protein [Bacteroidota bacterium]